MWMVVAELAEALAEAKFQSSRRRTLPGLAGLRQVVM